MESGRGQSSRGGGRANRGGRVPRGGDAPTVEILPPDSRAISQINLLKDLGAYKTEAPLSPRSKSWVESLLPMLEPYNYGAQDCRALASKLDFDPDRINEAVDSIVEENLGHETGQWTHVGKKVKREEERRSPGQRGSTESPNTAESRRGRGRGREDKRRRPTVVPRSEEEGARRSEVPTSVPVVKPQQSSRNNMPGMSWAAVAAGSSQAVSSETGTPAPAPVPLQTEPEPPVEVGCVPVDTPVQFVEIAEQPVIVVVTEEFVCSKEPPVPEPLKVIVPEKYKAKPVGVVFGVPSTAAKKSTSLKASETQTSAPSPISAEASVQVAEDTRKPSNVVRQNPANEFHRASSARQQYPPKNYGQPIQQHQTQQTTTGMYPPNGPPGLATGRIPPFSQSNHYFQYPNQFWPQHYPQMMPPYTTAMQAGAAAYPTGKHAAMAQFDPFYGGGMAHHTFDDQLSYASGMSGEMLGYFPQQQQQQHQQQHQANINQQRWRSTVKQPTSNEGRAYMPGMDPRGKTGNSSTWSTDDPSRAEGFPLASQPKHGSFDPSSQPTSYMTTRDPYPQFNQASDLYGPPGLGASLQQPRLPYSAYPTQD